ncbi:MAG: hypothetical protein IPK22_10255 [Verrucomicrobiaceae bacterium]|nr:hypothetical protein [Verrucomicrobiaceae bacterium]
MALSVSPAEFFSALLATGTANVAREELVGATADRVLRRAFDEALEDFSGSVDGVEWRPQAADEALRYVYRLCQALVDRAMTDEQVTALCAALPAVGDSPGELLAVDLALRHLPELHRMAKSMSSGDPLVSGLEAAARRYPLSGIGIALEEPLPDVAALKRHPGLWRLFIDRVIERQDVSRLADPAVRIAVADALGEHALKLAPKLAAQLALTHPS